MYYCFQGIVKEYTTTNGHYSYNVRLVTYSDCLDVKLLASL